MQVLSPREREKLILQHQPDALSTVKKHAPRGIPIEDIRQEAFVALVVAVDTYDPARGELTTHIYWTVRSAITALAERERTQSDPFAGKDGQAVVRNRMVRLDDPLPDDAGTRLDRLPSTAPSSEDVAFHKEKMAIAKIILGVKKTDGAKEVRRRVRRAAGKEFRVDAEVLAIARAM